MNIIKKIFDLIIIVKDYFLRICMMIKIAFYPASKISRSFWGGRNQKNWSLKSRYPKLYNSQERALRVFFRKRFGNRKINILDLGCADGDSSIFLVKDFIAYGQGFDISSNFIKSARDYARANKIKADFFVWDAFKQNLKITKAFDVVMALGLFTCITDEDVFHSIIGSIASQVKRGTYFIVKDTLAETLDAQKILKNHLYAAKYRYFESYLQNIYSRGFEKVEYQKLYQFPSEPYASYFLIFKKK